MDRVAAIVTAAGEGRRMGARKQFLELAPGERVVDRVVATCLAAAGWVGVVLPPGATWDGPSVDALLEGVTAVPLPRTADVANLHITDADSFELAPPSRLPNDRNVA